METFTRYLYEYRKGKRVRNAGFVKVEQSDSHGLIKIYGNGIGVPGETAELFLCEISEGKCIGIPAGDIRIERAGVRKSLDYTAGETGGEEAFLKIGGIVLKCRGGAGYPVFYAALWEEMPAAVEEMTVKGQAEAEEAEENEETVETEETARTAGEEIYAPAEEETIQPVREETVQSPQEDTVQPPQEDTVQPPQEDTSQPVQEEASHSAEAENPIYKIKRNDMAMLSKREWHLANNPFLLHGYRQYHHLVSFRQEDVSWLGVPGIYHPMEQRAADTYGFGQFMSPGEGEIVWEKDERAEDENFGYWCRQVSRVIAKTEADRR